MRALIIIGLLFLLGPATLYAEVPYGNWVKLPKACGSNLEKLCGGDQFKIRGNKIWWQTCKGVEFKVLTESEHTVVVQFAQRTPCYWFKQKVAGMKLETRENYLSIYGYGSMPPSDQTELFMGLGFERD